MKSKTEVEYQLKQMSSKVTITLVLPVEHISSGDIRTTLRSALDMYEGNADDKEGSLIGELFKCLSNASVKVEKCAEDEEDE